MLASRMGPRASNMAKGAVIMQFTSLTGAHRYNDPHALLCHLSPLSPAQLNIGCNLGMVV